MTARGMVWLALWWSLLALPFGLWAWLVFWLWVILFGAVVLAVGAVRARRR